MRIHQILAPVFWGISIQICSSFGFGTVSKRLFRERQFEFGRQKLTNHLKQGGYALRVVRRAVGGDTKAFGKLVALAYCIKGSGKHDLGIEWDKDNKKRKSNKKNAKSLASAPTLLPEPLQRVIEKQVTILPRSLRRVYRQVVGFDDVLITKFQRLEN
ncbi:hypothetical protein Gasu2_34740 [Galdieria sulphuraria]|nr:hypothetical protein Gasu2_34740 [Galdieria sulphuraria]